MVRFLDISLRFFALELWLRSPSYLVLLEGGLQLSWLTLLRYELIPVVTPWLLIAVYGLPLLLNDYTLMDFIVWSPTGDYVPSVSMY